MVWELRAHDVDQVMREVREAVRYWEEHPEEAEGLVRMSRFSSPQVLGSAALRLASSRALAAAQTDFRTILTRYDGWKGRLERLYKQLIRKSTSWLFFQQVQTNRALAMAVVDLADEVGELSERLRRLEAKLERRRDEREGTVGGGD